MVLDIPPTTSPPCIGFTAVPRSPSAAKGRPVPPTVLSRHSRSQLLQLTLVSCSQPLARLLSQF